MSLNPKLTDTDRLRHMRDAACAALRFVRGRTRADLDTDEMLAFALVRALEIIGEAADKLSDPAHAAHPSIPWSEIIGMRHKLIHGYFDVDLDIVWNVVTGELPGLVAWLDSVLSPPPGA
jgi:uncharacterized protein with HEPN domain